MPSDGSTSGYVPGGAYPGGGAYVYTRYPTASAYIPINTRPTFIGSPGSPAAWNSPPVLRPMPPIGRPSWSPQPLGRMSTPLGMRSFRMR